MEIFNKIEHLSTKRINTLPFRSHYIPFDVNQDFEFVHNIIDKTKSKLFISLNGEWSFKEHKKVSDFKYVNEELKDIIEVPSCVQMKGYDYIQYTNFKYPFPYNPPHIPEDNPCFHYRKTFNIKLLDKFYLVLEGVDNAFYLYINNKYVGYSTISHSKSEFDITPYLLDGDNTIDIIVLKWSKSSYVEDQDKFRFSGIFRDIYLLNRKEHCIWDYKVEPVYSKNNWYIKIQNLSNSKFNILFENKNYSLETDSEIMIQINEPIIWSPSNPHLYELTLFNKHEKILERVGLRQVSIKEGIFLINDKHIKLKGVNRHESNPNTGATVTIEDTYKDLLLIKDINANAIRTSHYPCIPEFYELCDVLGIYVLNEADVESHGAVHENYSLQSWQDFANSGLFDETIYDREVSLYERDKNRTSVIIWSIGNESNYGSMFYKGIDYIKSKDNRPIHYEGVFNLVDRSEYYTDRIDIISMMYPSVDFIKEKYLADPKEYRPLCLCEYSHSMGNSCGDVRDYWELINSTDRILGAFIWEWCDHAVEVDGKLLYGTDFPKRHNDGHFCVDGLVSPYREFKSNTLEVKAIYGGKYQPDEIEEEPYVYSKTHAKPQLNCKFNDLDGSLTTLMYKGKNIIIDPIKACFVRADIDNEMHLFSKLELYRKAKIVVLNKEIQETSTSYECVLVQEDSKEKLLQYKVQYDIDGNNLIVDLSYEILGENYPSRIGLSFSMDKFDTFEYKGYGPGESYIDKCVHNKYGTFTCSTKDNYGKAYLKPQESGSRYGTTKLVTPTFDVYADHHFSFNIQNYSIENIRLTKHNYELCEEDKTYINLDVFMNGVGSNSCGPELNKKYQAPKKGSGKFYILFK